MKLDSSSFDWTSDHATAREAQKQKTADAQAEKRRLEEEAAAERSAIDARQGRLGEIASKHVSNLAAKAGARGGGRGGKAAKAAGVKQKSLKAGKGGVPKAAVAAAAASSPKRGLAPTLKLHAPPGAMPGKRFAEKKKVSRCIPSQ